MITVFDANTTLTDLHKIEPVTPPNAGRRWRAIPHGELVETIKDEVVSRGWRIMKELYSTAREGADLAGALLVQGIKGVEEVPGLDWAIGFLHSNARRKALQITVGASVTCCLNGICTGNIVLSRVHDRTVDLINEIEAAIDRYGAAAAHIPSMVAALRLRELAIGEASEILMETGRRGLVGWAAVGRVDEEYRHPTFKEHGQNTSWALLNAFTYAARANIAPTRQMTIYDEFRKLLPVAA